MLVAPTSAIASSMISSSSASDIGGHELLQHRELLLFAEGLLLPAGPAEGLGGLETAFALALEHLQLLVVVQGPLQLLLGRAETGEDQAQRVAARLVTRDHRLLQLVLEPRDQAH